MHNDIKFQSSIIKQNLKLQIQSKQYYLFFYHILYIHLANQYSLSLFSIIYFISPILIHQPNVLHILYFYLLQLILCPKQNSMKKQDLGFGITGKKAQINSILNQKPKINNTPVIKKKQIVTTVKKGISTPKKIQTKLPKTQKKQEKTEKKNPEELQKKLQIKKVQQVKKQVIKVQKKQDIRRLVLIRYSHYKQKFEVLNDRLNFSTVDEKYCISFVFKGNFQPKFKDAKTNQYAEKQKNDWLLTNDEYILEIDQDQVQESKYEKKIYVAQKSDVCGLKKNVRVNQLTNDLKGLSIKELKQKGDKYKQLIQQRDLEDILYK